MKTVSILIAFTLLFSLFGCGAPPQPPETPPVSSPTEVMPLVSDPIEVVESDPEEIEKVVSGNSQFALDLYQVLRQSPGNLFFSPYSISLAMSMTYAGAAEDTEQQMADTLNYLDQDQQHPAIFALNRDLQSRSQEGAESDTQGFTLNIANSLWGQEDYPFVPQFLDTVAAYYEAPMFLVDYINQSEQARVQINDWVSEKTEEKIQDLIAPGVLDPLTRLVLVNAIYFNAAWQNQFEEGLTQEDIFTLLDGSEVTTLMMNQQETLGYTALDGLQVIRLPYKEDLASMVVILPDEGEFDALESSLDLDQLQVLLAQTVSQELKLTFPKFKFDSSFELVEAMQALGMSAPFSLQEADFSGMNADRELFISNILHKAFVDVDEQGTEATAATAVVMSLTSAMPVEPIEVRVDRPFIFLIQDTQTGTILFIGRVLDPR